MKVYGASNMPWDPEAVLYLARMYKLGVNIDVQMHKTEKAFVYIKQLSGLVCPTPCPSLNEQSSEYIANRKLLIFFGTVPQLRR